MFLESLTPKSLENRKQNKMNRISLYYVKQNKNMIACTQFFYTSTFYYYSRGWNFIVNFTFYTIRLPTKKNGKNMAQEIHFNSIRLNSILK